MHSRSPTVPSKPPAVSGGQAQVGVRHADFHLARMARADLLATATLWMAAASAVLWFGLAQPGLIIAGLLLPLAGFGAYASAQRALGNGWVATTETQGFAACAHWRLLGLERKSFERVSARWEEVDSYRYEWASPGKRLIVCFTECSALGKALIIDVTHITPPLTELLEAFKAGTGLEPGERRQEEKVTLTRCHVDASA